MLSFIFQDKLGDFWYVSGKQQVPPKKIHLNQGIETMNQVFSLYDDLYSDGQSERKPELINGVMFLHV